jgi:hypothetical protein
MSDRYIDGDVSEFILNAIRAGFAYRTGTLFTGVATGDTKKLLIENTNDDAVVFIVEPTVSSDGQFYATKTANPTVDTAGDAVTVTNKRSDTDGAGGITATTAGDGETGALSGGVSYPSVTGGSGANPSNQSPGETPSVGVSDMILPEESLTIEAENASGSTRDTSITAECIRIPTDKLGL